MTRKMQLVMQRSIPLGVLIFLTLSLSFALIEQSQLVFADVSISKSRAMTVDGEEILTLGLNSPAVFEIDFTNTENVPQPYLVVLEVRDARGITVYLQYQKGGLQANSATQVGISWTPEETGTYEARTLVLSSLENPTVLSSVDSTSVEVGTVVRSRPVIEPEENEIPVEPISNRDDPTLSELRQYALDLINKDRKEHGLNPVDLSDNEAAQIHAEDVFKTKVISHWMSNGEKPYMTYTRYGGTGDVAQNVAVSGDPQYYDDCTSGGYLCVRTNPFKEIEDHQYGMMYDDLDCCENGHRDNILDPLHTHVSIGIAYDDYFFAFAQNFENNYVDYEELSSDRAGWVTMEGFMENDKPAYIMIFYDEYPRAATYNKHRDDMSYSYGEHIAYVVEPLAAGWRYPPTTEYYIFEANQWRVDSDSFAIAFSVGQLVEKYDRGVYTVILMAGEEDNEYQVTSYSIFKE